MIKKERESLDNVYSCNDFLVTVTTVATIFICRRIGESWYTYQSAIWKRAEQILSSRIWLKAFCTWFSVYILKMLSLPMAVCTACISMENTCILFYKPLDGTAEIHICSILCWYVVCAGLQGFCAFFCHVLAVGLHHVGPQKPIPDTSKSTFTIHRYSIYRKRIHMF